MLSARRRGDSGRRVDVKSPILPYMHRGIRSNQLADDRAGAPRSGLCSSDCGETQYKEMCSIFHKMSRFQSTLSRSLNAGNSKICTLNIFIGYSWLISRGMNVAQEPGSGLDMRHSAVPEGKELIV
jgi:hypothetical protein